MQISRHWRMNSLRYRLEGVRYQTGEVSLQDRPMVHNDGTHSPAENSRDSKEESPVVVAA